MEQLRLMHSHIQWQIAQRRFNVPFPMTPTVFTVLTSAWASSSSKLPRR
jgi:hypothetical protein